MSDKISNKIDKYSDLPLYLISNSPFSHNTPTSFGLIVYAIDTQRWFLVRRRHSASLIILLWGCYQQANIPDIIASLANNEVPMVIDAMTSKYKYAAVLFDVHHDLNTKNIDYGYARLQESQDIINKCLEKRDKDQVILTDWFWAKGHRKQYPVEGHIEAAMREFKEESGIKDITCPYTICFDPIKFLSRGITGRYHQCVLWVCVFKNEIPAPEPDDEEIEVSERKWMTYEEAMSVLPGTQSETLIEAEEKIKSILSLSA